MEYSAICHDMDKRYCYAIDKGRFVFRIKAKKNDLKRIELHYQDKNISIEDIDTRKISTMKKIATDKYTDYFETIIEFDVRCLRYYFELEDYDGNIKYYGNYEYYDELISDIHFMFDCPQTLREEEMFIIPEWAKNKVVYQIFPSRYATTEQISEEKWYKVPISSKDNLKGNLRGIINKLDYIEKLGVDIIYMTPIFESNSSHKYDTIDYFKIDSSFGTEKDLKELVDNAHAKGMKVILDGVFNHTAREFFAFKDIIDNGKDSKYVDWYYIEGFPVKAEKGKRPNYKTFSYYGGMPKLNLKNKEAQEYILKVVTYWMQNCNIDGWRLDVGDEISHRFWKKFRDTVKKINPQALIIGEIWHCASDFLEGDEWDTVMNYHFFDAIKALIAKEKITMSEFVGSLDFMKGTIHYKVHDALWNLIDSHDTERFINCCNKDKNKFKLAVAFQLMLPGAPMIYYGDEVGMEGAHDPDCRRGMLWKEELQDKDILDWYKKLIEIRRKYKCITEGEIIEQKINDDTGIWEITKEYKGNKVKIIFHSKNSTIKFNEYCEMFDIINDVKFDGYVKPYGVYVLGY